MPLRSNKSTIHGYFGYYVRILVDVGAHDLPNYVNLEVEDWDYEVRFNMKNYHFSARLAKLLVMLWLLVIYWKSKKKKLWLRRRIKRKSLSMFLLLKWTQWSILLSALKPSGVEVNVSASVAEKGYSSILHAFWLPV